MTDRSPSQERVSSVAGFALGMATMLTVTTLGPAEDFYIKNQGSLRTRWIATVVVAIAAVVILSVKSLRRNPYVGIAVCAFIPITIATAVGQSLGARTAEGRAVRTIGMVIAFGATFGAAVWFLRIKRELDREIFTQAAIVAFFATVVAGVLYGAAQESFGAPDIALTWLSLFGLAAFVVALSIFERRYS